MTVWLAALALAGAAQAREAVLYERTSDYANVVVTDEGNGLRALRFGRNGARQSLVRPGDPEFLGLPYTRGALAGLAFCETVRRILVVGLGGGTLPAFLRRYYPDATIDAVEIDPEVVFVAKTYFGFTEDERMRVHVSDGRQFIEAAREPYDAIFLDAFGADTVPPHMATREFLDAVRGAVSRSGVVVGNIWGPESNRLYDSMVRTYREAFDELIVLRIAGSGNRILLALPRAHAVSRDDTARRARGVSSSRGFQFDLGSVVDRSYLPAGASGWGGRVLRDADLKR